MIVSIRGPIGAGKTEACKFLVESKGFVKVSFADPLKLEVFDYLWEPNGKTDLILIDAGFKLEDFPNPRNSFPVSELYYIEDEQKLEWVNANKIVLRPLLQWWGTEYRRAQDEDYWIKKAVEKIKELQRTNHNVCMDDCRFDNEIDTITKLGGSHIYLNPSPYQIAQRLESRDGGEAASIPSHASERLADAADPRNWLVITNEGEIRDLQNNLDYVTSVLEWESGAPH